jgi:hypothetical protein
VNAALFWRGVLVALAISTIGAAGFALLAPLIGGGFALKLLLLGVAAACLVEQLLRGPPAGRMLAVAGAVLLALALLAIDPPRWLWLALPLGALWLQRALLLHRRPTLALLDAALLLVGLAAALAAFGHSGSLWLGLWCFLLAQALAASVSAPPHAQPTVDRFAAARRSAEAALRALLHPRPVR